MRTPTGAGAGSKRPRESADDCDEAADGGDGVAVERTKRARAAAPFLALAVGDDDGLLLTVMQYLDNKSLFRGVGLACHRFERLAWHCVKPTQRARETVVTQRKGTFVSLQTCTSITHAASFGCARAVEHMLKMDDPRFDPSVDDSLALLFACQGGHAEVVRMLLDDGRTDPATEYNLSIQIAVTTSHTDVLRMLLDDGRADPSDEGDNYALLIACESGHAECARMLLADPRVDPTAECNRALQLACDTDRANVVQLLLADRRVDMSVTGDDLNVNLQTLFYDACATGSASVARLLLPDPRVDPTAFHNSAFFNACLYGRTEIVRLLLADGRVDPTAKDNECLLIARRYDSAREVAQLLLADQRVADLDARSGQH